MNKKLKEILKRLGFVLAFPVILFVGFPLYCLYGVAVMVLALPYYVLTGEDLISKADFK